ncbi:MAG: hypothetical protein AAFV54_14240, partial [Pseudomonadota bacterium]
VAQPMPPMQKPDWPAGTEWQLMARWRVMIDGGGELWWRIDKKGKRTFTTVDSRGCRRMYEDWFTPPLMFRDCDFARVDLVQEVERTGETWPLQLGRSWSYTVSGLDHRGTRWRSRKAKCFVDSAVQVTIEAGSFDTYKVVCRSMGVRETWYMSPSLGTFAIYIREPDAYQTEYIEYVALDLPE